MIKLKHLLTEAHGEDIDVDKLFWSPYYLEDVAEKFGYETDFTKVFWSQHYIPTLYHCTTKENYENIKTKGLEMRSERRGATSGNSAIGDAVFTTAESEEVSFFKSYYGPVVIAFNAKHESKTQWDNYPIVLELTVPDRNKIYPDFDADFSTTTPRYYSKSPGPDTKSSMKSMGLSRETGKWGYKGRIPASFIRWVYYYKPYEGKWHKSRPDTWMKLLNHKDWEQISWKLGMQDIG